MGTYLNPHDDILKGRKLEQGDYEQLTAQLLPGERLYGYYDRIAFRQSPLLDSAEEMTVFEDQVQRGAILRLGFYAVKTVTENSGITSATVSDEPLTTEQKSAPPQSG